MFKIITKDSQQTASKHVANRFFYKSYRRLGSLNEGACLTSGFNKITNLYQPHIQPKLKIGAPNDRYEQEADRVADQVMRMPISGSVHTQSPPQIQRMCSECEDEIQRQPEEEEEEEELIQTKSSTGNTPQMSSQTASGIQNIGGGGQPMSQTTRAFMEPRFSKDFSQVKIHDDSHANALASSINAKAFTYRNNIVFGAGQYQPESIDGRRLLAHELTHVIQQGSTASHGTAIQREEHDEVPSPDAESPEVDTEIQRIRSLRMRLEDDTEVQTGTTFGQSPQPGTRPLSGTLFPEFSNFGRTQIDLSSAAAELRLRGVMVYPGFYSDALATWNHSFYLFHDVLGLDNDLSTTLSNATFSSAIGAGLSHDYPTIMEQSDRELGISSTILPVSSVVQYIYGKIVE